MAQQSGNVSMFSANTSLRFLCGISKHQAYHNGGTLRITSSFAAAWHRIAWAHLGAAT